MVVIVIVGILATLAYSGLTEVIFVNRAKETAQTIRTFTERALIDAKRENRVVKIYISSNTIIAEDTAKNNPQKFATEVLQGFSASSSSPDTKVTIDFGKEGVVSKSRIGLSGIAGQGYFTVCGVKDYCASAVKFENENSLKAYIRKGKNASWEAL